MSVGERYRWTAGIGIAALAALIVTSCSLEASGQSAGSAPDEQPTMALNLRDTKRAFRDVFDVLGAAGWTPLVGSGDFAPCGDAEVAFEPALTGQLRRADGRSATEADAVSVRDLLVDAGWGLDESAPFVDGIAATHDGWEVGLFDFEFDDIVLRVVLSGTAPEVDVSATGVCLPSTAAEQEFYDAMGTWYLNALVPSTPATAPS